jgi:hypothetical protein
MGLLANRDYLRRILAVSVCLVLFLFVFQARPDFHGKGVVQKIYPHDSHKARLEANSFKTLLPAIAVFWFVPTGMYYLLFRGQPLVQKVFSSLVAHDAVLQYRRRFLRPPPLVFS